MRKYLPLLVMLSLLLPSLAVAQAAPAGDTPKVPKVPFEKHVLPNGLELILHPDKKLPMVHVNLWYHVGSKNEKAGRTGFAHLFEHMMFQGSKNAGDEYLTGIEKAGANLFEGGVNGTTNQDRTNYFETVPAGSLEYVLWLESDRLATLLDVTDIKKLDNQREVVRNERRQGLENQPYGRWWALLPEYLFPKGHPYSWSVIGSHEDLKAATLDDVKDFFRTYYSPNNLSMVIAGDFDPAEAKRLVEKYFGAISPGPPLDRPARWIPRLERERVVEVADRVPQQRVYFAWVTPPFFENGDAELDLLSLILTDGLSARLNKTLVYEKQLATNVVSFQQSGELASAFVLYATARPGASLAEIEKIIKVEIKRLAGEGPSAEELQRAQNKQEYQFVTGLERIGGFGGKADMLNRYNIFLGDPGMMEKDLGRYRGATAADIRNVVAAWLDAPALVMRFHPEKGGRINVADIDRSKRPALGADRPFNAPEVKSAKLENGLEVLVVERPELPKVAVQLATRSGSVYDPAGKSGTANLVTRVLDKGTATRNALQIADGFGDLGTAFAAAAERENSNASMEVLTRNLPAALTLFADVVRNPSFPQEEFEREKKRQLDTLAQQSNNPNAVASRISPMLVFGPDHPYGRPVAGLPSSVPQITRDDLAALHKQTWRPGGSALIFVGDITLARATELARKEFGAWSGAAPEAPQIPAPKPMPAGRIYLVDRQDAAQTVVSQLLAAPDRKTPDYYALKLADAVWGGGFSTRLNLNLRENKGYSYGVFSFPVFYSKAGIWRASGGVQTDKTKESLVEFVSELKGIAGEKPITSDELEGARNNRVRGYAQQFESHARIAEQVSDVWVDGLPMTELQREPDQFKQATLEAVNGVAKKYAAPEQVRTLLVGDVGKIRTGVQELDLGEIVLLDVEGRPVQQTASGQ